MLPRYVYKQEIAYTQPLLLSSLLFLNPADPLPAIDKLSSYYIAETSLDPSNTSLGGRMERIGLLERPERGSL